MRNARASVIVHFEDASCNGNVHMYVCMYVYIHTHVYTDAKYAGMICMYAFYVIGLGDPWQWSLGGWLVGRLVAYLVL